MENILAESLMLKFQQEEIALIEYRKELDELYNKAQADLYKIKSKAQDVCTHPTIRSEDAYNYHTREDWTKDFCTVCGKMVRKY